MKQIKSFFKKPLNWVIIIAVGLILYFLGGIIVKFISSIFLLWIAYWISKFTGPYYKKTAARRTIDRILSGESKWNGTIRDFEIQYKINKIGGYVGPYLFAIILIISIWTTHEDKEKATDVAMVNTVEDSNGSTNNITLADATNAEIEQEMDSNAEDYPDLTANWNNKFPTPEYIYTGLLNPLTKDQGKFFTDLIEHDFNCVEQLEYTNSAGSLLFEPGTAQDAVFINIYEYAERQQFEERLNTFFSDKTNCSVDYCGDGTIVITYDYQ